MWKKLLFVGLLIHSINISASPTPLLKVDFISEYGPVDEPIYQSTCTIYTNGKLTIHRHNTFDGSILIGPQAENVVSPNELTIQETRSLKFSNLGNIKQAIALAATGTIHGPTLVGFVVGLEYVAFNGSTPVMLKGRGNIVNDSVWTNRLIAVIDNWCGDISK